MSQLNYRLIISDFDGTLVSANGEISAENKQAIQQYVQAGGYFVISTGRMPDGILPRLHELGLTGLVSCCQGSIIMDIESQKTLLQGKVDRATAIAVCKHLEALDLHIHVYDLFDCYANKDDEALRLYEKIVRVKAKLVLDKPLSQYIEETGMDVYKILIMVEPEHNDKVYKTLYDMQFPNCTVTKSAAYLVEVANAAYSKGTAVSFLAQHFNVPIEQTLAVGDEGNDLSMICAAGLGVAVKNAAKELKEHAVTLERTNEESAIAEVIEKYGIIKE